MTVRVVGVFSTWADERNRSVEYAELRCRVDSGFLSSRINNYEEALCRDDWPLLFCPL